MLNGERRGIGWVVSNFPLKAQISCDAAFYRSSLVVNISRPEVSTFCFETSARNSTEEKYSCDLRPYPGQVTTVQILAAANNCSDAVSAVTVDGQAWPHFSLDPTSNILSIERLNTVVPPDVDNLSNRRVCIALKPQHPTCASLPAFCAPTYGPEPACGILVADSRGACCPVFRAGFRSAPIRTPLTYIFSARLTGPTYGCDQVSGDAAAAADLTSQIAIQYEKALELDPSNVKFLSYQCRGERFGAILQVTGLSGSGAEAMLTKSVALLRPVITPLGLAGIRVTPYSAPPPRSPRDRSPVSGPQLLPPIPPVPAFPASPSYPASPSGPTQSSTTQSLGPKAPPAAHPDVAQEPPSAGPATYVAGPGVYGYPPAYGAGRR